MVQDILQSSFASVNAVIVLVITTFYGGFIMNEENFKDYIVRLEEECFIRNRTYHTTHNYVSAVNAFLKSVDCESVNELTLLHARNYIISLRKAGNKASSCNAINSAISFFYQKVLHKRWDYDEVPRMKRD